jgi:hypothetical protein
VLNPAKKVTEKFGAVTCYKIFLSFSFLTHVTEINSESGRFFVVLRPVSVRYL